jgi:hypothetical protein
MKDYSINITYKTGDSYSSSIRQSEIELQWNNLKIAKENLLRIKEHYDWYNDNNSTYKSGNIPEPEWHKNIKTDKYIYDQTMFLKTDDGDEMIFYPFWFGYFERLISAEIIFINMKIKF